MTVFLDPSKLALILALIGFGGTASYLAGRWLASSVFRILGLGGCATGFGTLLLCLIGVLPGDFMAWFVPIKQLIVATPTNSWSPTIDARAGAYFNDVDRGKISEQEFSEVLEVIRVRSAAFGKPDYWFNAVTRRLKSGSLSRSMASKIANWVVLQWPTWRNPDPNVIDDIYVTLLTASAPGDIAKRVDFLLTAHSDRSLGEPSGGLVEALDVAAWTGQMDNEQLKRYLTQLAAIQLTCTSATGNVLRGELVEIKLAETRNRGFGSRLPWRGTARPRPTGWEGEDGFIRLGLDRGEGIPMRLRAPDKAGKYEVTYDIETQLTRTELRSSYLRNPGNTPVPIGLHDRLDMRVVSTTSIVIVVDDKLAPAAIGVEDSTATESIRSQLAERFCVHFVERDGVVYGEDTVRMNQPPVNVAFDIFWADGEHEVKMGWFYAVAGEWANTRYSAPIGPLRRGNRMNIIFRPNPGIADHWRKFTKYWIGSDVQVRKCAVDGED